ncbi:Ig-like domain-containing protein, partial [Vibrio sp. ER1A]|uniref:Ig-like domain-containing protein n=1 Tax=Vibrio sp. ER1A TaxID=1517681 RepID=UPI000571779A
SKTEPIEAGEMSPTQPPLRVCPATIAAGGPAGSRRPGALKDAQGNAVSGKTVVLGATGVSGVTVGATTETATSGTYTATLTAGNTAGVATTTVTVDGESFAVASQTVTIEAGQPNAEGSTFVSSAEGLIGNNIDNSTLTFRLRDAHGNPVSSTDTISFATIPVEDVNIDQINNDDSENGVFTARLRAGAEGAVRITATVGDISKTISVSFEALGNLSLSTTYDGTTYNAGETISRAPANVSTDPDWDMTFTLSGSGVADEEYCLIYLRTTPGNSFTEWARLGCVTAGSDGRLNNVDRTHDYWPSGGTYEYAIGRVTGPNSVSRVSQRIFINVR